MLRKYIFYLFNFLIIIAPLVLFLLPINFFDAGKSICLSKTLAGIECYACGMTRAVMHMIHFDFKGAWEFNKLSFIVLPMLVPIWMKSIYNVRGKKMPGLLGKII